MAASRRSPAVELAAGLSLCGYLAGGLRWFAMALLASLAVALFNAWALLVEIIR
jgi:hypothetical protein